MTRRMMRWGIGVAVVSAVLGLGSASGPGPGPALATIGVPGEGGARSPEIDYGEIARGIVGHSAAVRDGEFVLISGGVRDLELLEDLAIETRRHGAWPLVTLGSDRMTRLMYDDVPAELDTQRPELALRLVGLFSVNINVDFSENEAVLEGVPPDRIAAQAKAFQPVGDLARGFHVRTVNLGNGFYPTEQRAARFGISRDKLARIFWDGVATDPEVLRRSGMALKRLLDEGHTVQVTNPNGTDLTLELGGAPVLISDGVVSPDDERVGGAATTVWLPAGEVFTTPLSGTASGVVVAESFYYQGRPVKGLRLEFADGVLTAMNAEEGLEPVREFFDAAGEGRDQFAVIDIGLNPNVELAPGSRMAGWMAAGMVTLGMGNNAWAGGSNNVNFALYPFMPGSTVTIDGTVVVEDGALLTETLMGVR